VFEGGVVVMSFGLVWMVLILLGVVVLAAWWVKALFPSVSTAASQDRERAQTPLEIARRRYAAGEITKEQYDEVVRAVS
jgi:putative membrane protein